MTFLYSFLHNHKDMVNLKNIFFFKNHFSNFIIEKNGNFEGCLIGAVKPLKINGRLKMFMFTNIQGIQNICANFRLNISRITSIGLCWAKILGQKYASIYSIKMYTCATCRCRYSVGFSPLVHTCPVEAKEQIIGNFRHEFE